MQQAEQEAMVAYLVLAPVVVALQTGPE